MVAPLSRERNLVARVTRDFDAPRPQVWSGILDIGWYMPVADTSAEWRPGGAIRWKAELLGRIPVEVHGAVDELDPGRAVSWHWRDPLLHVVHHVAMELSETGTGTRLVLEEDGHATEKELAHAEGGWRLMLSNLKFQLENRQSG